MEDSNFVSHSYCINDNTSCITDSTPNNKLFKVKCLMILVKHYINKQPQFYDSNIFAPAHV